MRDLSGEQILALLGHLGDLYSKQSLLFWHNHVILSAYDSQHTSLMASEALTELCTHATNVYKKLLNLLEAEAHLINEVTPDKTPHLMPLAQALKLELEKWPHLFNAAHDAILQHPIPPGSLFAQGTNDDMAIAALHDLNTSIELMAQHIQPLLHENVVRPSRDFWGQKLGNKTHGIPNPEGLIKAHAQIGGETGAGSSGGSTHFQNMIVLRGPNGTPRPFTPNDLEDYQFRISAGNTEPSPTR